MTPQDTWGNAVTARSSDPLKFLHESESLEKGCGPTC